MSKEHSLIVVPGLGGENQMLKMIVDSWSKHGINGYIHDAGWRGNEETFQTKLEKLINQVDKLSIKGKVSLLGTSAGGSAVINTFNERKNKIYKVVNVCGRLRTGFDVYPTLETASRSSISFKQSVLLCEKVQRSFNEEDRKKVITIRPLFDKTVPISTMTIVGARNERIISVGHVFSIALAMTLYSKKVINFLNN